MTRRDLLLRKEPPEAVESVLPQRAVLGDPTLGPFQAAGLEAARAHPTDLLGPDHAAVLQDLDVLHDGRERHGERLGEVADRDRAPAQPLDHRATRRVGQGPEGVVELRRVCHHSTSEYRTSPHSQAVT